MMYKVEVWFATSYGYQDIGQFTSLSVAQREARAYLSDSRGIRILDVTGAVVEQIKESCR